MNPEALPCAGCGAPLPSPTAVCPRCDAADQAQQASGRHVCPHCGGRFDRAGTVGWPLKAPWWRWQKAMPACPCCGQVLLDRALPPASPWRLAALLATLAAVVGLAPSGAWQNLGVVAASWVYSWVSLRPSRRIRDQPDRYLRRPP